MSRQVSSKSYQSQTFNSRLLFWRDKKRLTHYKCLGDLAEDGFALIFQHQNLSGLVDGEVRPVCAISGMEYGYYTHGYVPVVPSRFLR